MSHAVLRCFVLALALPLCACGGRIAPPVDLAAGGFELEILPASLAPGGSFADSTLDISETAGRVVVDVRLKRARDLKALYFELRYDSAALTALSAQASTALTGTDGLLQLAVLDEPGTAVFGAVLIHADVQAGFSGDGALARVEFARQPSSTSSTARRACLAPVGDRARVPLGLSTAPAMLRWRYYNPGDYDQNHEVSISDLTPLGRYFGDSGPFAPNSIQAVVDGDGNGEINIADLTPIGANLQRRVSGYRVYSSTDEGDYPAGNDEPSSIDWAGVTSEATGDAGAERLLFEFSLGAVEADQHYWVRPFDGAPMQPDAHEGTPSVYVTIADPGVVPPAALIMDNPSLGLAPLAVHFSGENSTDDTGIALYEWDFESDGVVDFSSAQPGAEHAFTAAGNYIVSLRVTDLDGETNSTGASIEVSAPVGWQLTLGSDELEIGTISRLILADGQPALAVASSSAELYFLRASDGAASSWAAPQLLDTAGLHSDSFALALIGGVPALACAAIELDDLFYIRASNAQGSDWEPAHHALTYSEIHEVDLVETADGRPLAAFAGYPGLGSEIDVVLGDDAAGSAWGAPIIVEGGDLGYGAPDCAFINGHPSMVFIDQFGQAKYATSAGTPDGTEWTIPELIAGDNSFSATLAEVQGRPAVVFASAFAPVQMVYVRADDAGGATWTPNTVPDPEANLTATPRLFMLGGSPAILYASESAHGSELFVIQAADQVGDDWAAPQLIGEFNHPYALRALELGGGELLLAFCEQYFSGQPLLEHRELYFAVRE